MAARRATQLLSPPATQLLPPPATLAAPSRRHQSGVSSHRPARPIHLHARSPPCPLHHRAIGSTLPRSSGHNRWSKIRHKKGAADAQRSALFSRFTHVCFPSSPQDRPADDLDQELYQALRPPSSPDPAFNQRLALAVSKAREGGMTKIAIEAVMARVGVTSMEDLPLMKVSEGRRRARQMGQVRTLPMRQWDQEGERLS